jgi:protein-disulfide isomerase
MSLRPAVSSIDHVQGNANAAVELLEFGDYQCGFCGAAFPIIKEIQETFGDQVKFVFRNFPLVQAHPYARIAALAAEAAALQGKFWEMHDAIYMKQDELGEELFIRQVEKLGLDVDQFKKDMESEKVQTKVEDDFESGIRSGVNGTPSFFVNGEKFDGGATDLYAMLKESSS